METEYYGIIALAFFGFVALAALLLVPVYRFLRKEEKAAESWTKEELEERARRLDSAHPQDES